MRRNFYSRHRHPRWPHFDNRGPEHYYDDYPQHGRHMDYHGQYEPQGYHNDSDIYEDEFEERYDDHGSYGSSFDGPWPEDEFYRNRQQMQWGGEPPRRWQRLLRPFYHDQPYQRGYPEDQHEHSYGRNIHDRNNNRGRALRPYYREY